MAIFLIIFLTVLGLIYTYVGWRLIGPSQLRRTWKRAAWATVYFFLGLFLVMVVFHIGNIESVSLDALSWVVFVSFGLVVLLFTLLLIRDIVWLVARVGSHIARLARVHPLPRSNPGPGIDQGRRRFLIQTSNLGILGLSGALSGYGFYEARRRPAVVEITVPLANLSSDLEGFRIAQITDIHAGPTVKGDWIQAVVEDVNRLAPDLIAVTGDLVDGTAQYLRDDISPLGDLSAPHGTYFVTGNHEYYSGVQQWLEELDHLGLRILLNEHIEIQRHNAKMVLAGVTDYSGGRMLRRHQSDPHAALAGAPLDRPKILLAHQPVSIHAAAEAGYDLQLSGHTHGGQFFPGNFIARLAQPYLSGLHKHDNTWIYVSRGTGYWGPPLRIGQPSEITVVTLARA